MSKRPTSPSSPNKRRSRKGNEPADLEDHEDSNSVGYNPRHSKPYYIDSVGELRSNYTIDEESGLFVERPMAGPTNPSKPSSSDPKGKNPAQPSSPPKREPDDSDDEGPPDVNMDDATLPTPSGGAVKIDGEVYFDGSPDQLPTLWLHMFEKAALDPNMDSEQKKCAYLCTRFKGSPREWLIQQHGVNALIFSDYNAMVQAVKDKYERADDIQTHMYRQQIMRLRQTGTVAQFIQEFDILADRLGWTDEVRSTMVLERVNKDIRDHMITFNEMPDDYDGLKADLVSIDATKRLLKGTNETKTKSRKKSKKGKAKCGQCGKTGHTADKCWGKKTVNMISIRGGHSRTPSLDLTVLVEGKRLTALVDSGAAVSCIRAELVTGQTFRSNTTLQGPTGQVMAEDASFLVTSIDGTPQKLYLVPGLVEEVILGRPYLDNSDTHDMCAFALTDHFEVPGRLRELSLAELEALDDYIETALLNDWIEDSDAQQAHDVLFVPQ